MGFLLKLLGPVGAVLGPIKWYLIAAAVAAALTFHFVSNHNAYVRGKQDQVTEDAREQAKYEEAHRKAIEKAALKAVEDAAKFTNQLNVLKGERDVAVRKAKELAAQLNRPAVCDLSDSEFLFFRDQVRDANGTR